MVGRYHLKAFGLLKKQKQVKSRYSFYSSQSKRFPDIDIKPEDVLCYSCYKVHLLIIKSNEQLIGSNQQLQDEISVWTGRVYNNTSEPTKSILYTVITVANHLLQNRAILLPVLASKIFISSYSQSDDLSPSVIDIDLDLGEYSIKFTSNWLLHQLIIHLQSYMDYKCVLKKYGTVMCHKNGNLLHSKLSVALGTCNYCKENEKVKSFLPTNVTESSSSILEKAGVITETDFFDVLTTDSCIL